jgi:soluble lytic murein transglycosylase-like protein
MKLKNENLYDPIFKRYAQKYGHDWLLLKAQVKQESAFKPDAVSPVGAQGLSQFMPKTWLEWEDETPGVQDLKKDFDPFNPEDSIRVQAAYMNWLRQRILKQLGNADQLIEWQLAAYNWGIGNVEKKMKDSKNYYLIERTLPLETKDYVRNILLYYRTYIGAFTNAEKKS